MRVVGYLRVSTAEQGESGAGLAAQRAEIERAAEYHRWELVEVFEDVASGKSTNGRHGLRDALAVVESGEAEALVVAKLDRVSRSVADFAGLMERARRARSPWAIVVLDLNIDTTTTNGAMVANILAVLAEWERRMIGDRTRDGLAAKRREGVRLGRPRELPPAVRRRIARERAKGLSYARIAERLNPAAVPTAHGGARWYPATVRAVERAA